MTAGSVNKNWSDSVTKHDALTHTARGSKVEVLKRRVRGIQQCGDILAV